MAQHPHMPAPGRRVPVTTYRLQMNPDFTFDDARAVLPYLRRLGVTDIYLSPILQPVPGSRHGYDVVDHTHVNAELGGRPGFERLADAAHERGIGVIVDIVPNHMAVPTPVWLNRALWSVLKHGASSRFASWFDVELDQPILMPVLGDRIGQVLSRGELQLAQMQIPTEPQHGRQWVLRYFDHVFPVAAGTESLPLTVLLDRQHYRLAHWKVADEELNYRRFFDVGTLAAIRVERPDVFDATHALLLDLFGQGRIDGFRVDHPDGLADPRGYFHRLAQKTGGAWIAAEKILEEDEDLPGDWPVAGTTGYDTAWRIHAVQVDPRGSLPLGACMQEVAGDSPASFPQVVAGAKRHVLETSLAAEVRRLASLVWGICQSDLRLRDHTFRALAECLRGLIVEMPRYRAYMVPDQPAPQGSREVVEQAAERALRRLDPDLEDTMGVLVHLLLGDEVGTAGLSETDARRNEVAVRFQQVCGAVMAKGVEDTAFYRWTHLVSLCEVGGSPMHFGLDIDQFHAFEARIQANWPATMTNGTTHDSKRCEDVRARLAVLASYPREWTALLAQLRFVTAPHRPASVDGRAENLLWQTIVATWGDADPLTPARLESYLIKAVREQKTWTSWTSPDIERENELLGYARFCLGSQDVADLLGAWEHATRRAQADAILVTKALQLTVPGVADIYQGEEITRTSLVDPDNRRLVDYKALKALLDDVEGGKVASLDARKLRLTCQIARLRRRRPEAFASERAGYRPLPASTTHAIAFARTVDGEPAVLTVAQCLEPALERMGGWSGQTVVLPERPWTDVLSGRKTAGGPVPLADLLGQEPVAVLEADRP